MHQTEFFEAGSLFASVTGIIPIPESSHAIRLAIDEALECKRTGEKKTIFFNQSGQGLLDLSAYDEYNHRRLQDFEPAEITFGH
ncbi:MAG: hypothetical protein ABSG92_07110 [Conexivisphaerales archaeon]